MIGEIGTCCDWGDVTGEDLVIPAGSSGTCIIIFSLPNRREEHFFGCQGNRVLSSYILVPNLSLGGKKSLGGKPGNFIGQCWYALPGLYTCSKVTIFLLMYSGATVSIATTMLDKAGSSMENSCWLRDGGQSREPCSGPMASFGTHQIRWYHCQVPSGGKIVGRG